MNDADSTPSPNRFCRMLGMRKPALNASAVAESPRKWAKMLSRTRPAMRLSNTPAAMVPAWLAPDPLALATPGRGLARGSLRSWLGATSDKLPLTHAVYRPCRARRSGRGG